MAGLDHRPATPDEPEDMTLAAANARTGMVLFVIYFVFYAAYVGMAAFAYKSFAATSPLTGTLAIDFGMALIVGAMGIAVLYGWLCRANVSGNPQPPVRQGGKR
jgi:uncharacterized membrane protein (DUF485 family)